MRFKRRPAHQVNHPPIRTPAVPRTARFRGAIRTGAKVGAGFAVLMLPLHATAEDLTFPETPQHTTSHDLTMQSLLRLNRSCTLCHEIDPMFSHPVGITPSMDVPPELPLLNNTLACLTCHESESGRRHVNAPHQSRIRLRTDTGLTSLCARCHDPFGMDRVNAHASSLSMAHTLTIATREFGGGMMDRDTWETNTSAETKCLSCHDGSLASDVGHTTNGLLGSGSIGPDDGGHPVGTEYRMTNADDADGELRPVSELDHRIRLDHNRVSCQSCHSQYARRPGHLVIDNHRSSLCLSCHLY